MVNITQIIIMIFILECLFNFVPDCIKNLHHCPNQRWMFQKIQTNTWDWRRLLFLCSNALQNLYKCTQGDEFKLKYVFFYKGSWVIFSQFLKPLKKSKQTSSTPGSKHNNKRIKCQIFWILLCKFVVSLFF